MENIEFFDEIVGPKSVENKLDLFLILNENQIVVDCLDDVSNLDFFENYKYMEDPNQWIKTIKIRDKIDGYYVFINFKKPDVNSLGAVSKGHVQIFLYNDYNKVGYLNAWLCPQSGKIKFSGMRKLDKIEDGIANTLLNIYLELAKKFKYEGNIIDYSQTTSQTKIDVAYFLQMHGYVANSKSPQNRFSIYKDVHGKIYIYTVSSNKVRGDNAHQYSYLSFDPGGNHTQFKHLGDVFIGSNVIYRYNEQ